MTTLPKLLYLGFAFPPGVSGLYPEAQPAGHLVETSLINSLRPWFEIRSVGISWIRVEQVPPGDPSPGLPHVLNLMEAKPELLHRLLSLRRLKRHYIAWIKEAWVPDVILICNFSPVYNGFTRWLKRRPGAPPVVLYLADSMNLQRKFPWLRRWRHRFKPMVWPDSEMVQFVDACVAVSLSTRQFFGDRNLPWLWLPNGCDSKRAIQSWADPAPGPIRFGYVGALAGHTGLPDLMRVFLSRQRQAELHICGFGKTKTAIAEECRKHPQLAFHEPRTADQCVQLAHGWDVLVNARPNWPGNENNFPSKVFEYALSGCAILTSPVSGADQILGEDAFYFDETEFDRSLDDALERVSTLPRVELHQRGMKIQERLLSNYSWAQQGQCLADFLLSLLASSFTKSRQPH